MAEEDAVCPSLGEIAGWVIFAFLTQERSRHHLYVHIWMSDESIPFCVHLPFMQQTTFFFLAFLLIRLAPCTQVVVDSPAEDIFMLCGYFWFVPG